MNYLYNGGWDSNATDDVLVEWDYWYTSQNDTEFRRYKTVDFKAVVTPEISNQIYEYLSDNPGSTISIRSAWHADLNDTNTNEDPLDPYDTQTDESDLQYTNWNRQPQGMGYANTSSADFVEQAPETYTVNYIRWNSWPGATNICNLNYTTGGSTGSTTLQGNLNETNVWNAVEATHAVSRRVYYRIESVLNSNGAVAMPLAHGWRWIEEDDGEGNTMGLFNECTATNATLTHYITNNNSVASRTIGYINGSGAGDSIILSPNDDAQICAEIGSLTGLGSDISVSVSSIVCT